MSTDTPAAAPTAEREAFEAHIERTHQTPGLPFNREMVLYRTETGRYFHGWLESQWYGWQARAALSAPVAAQPAASGVDALWVETANDLADKAIAAEREFTEAEVEALCSTIRSDLNLKAGRAREALRTHLSTALTGAAKD